MQVANGVNSLNLLSLTSLVSFPIVRTHALTQVPTRTTLSFYVEPLMISSYDNMIINFCKKWTVHALDEVKMFFGIRFICSDRCVTLDQTHKIKDIIADVFGPSHDKQLGSKGYSTPMIAGTEHPNDLAACTPNTTSELIIAQKQTFPLDIVMFWGDVCIVHFSTFSRHVSFWHNIKRALVVYTSKLSNISWVIFVYIQIFR
jgi:hypothetical protein